MTDPRLTFALMLAFAALFVVCIVMLNGRVRQAELVARRVRSVNAGPARAGRGRNRPVANLMRLVAGVGVVLLRFGLVPRKTQHEARLLMAGVNMRGETAVAAFVGGKMLLLAGLPAIALVCASALGQTGYIELVAAAAGAIVALVAPAMAMGRRRRRRLAAIDRGLPDALDLLVICVDAGLAFEPALERVTRELAAVHPEIAEEFAVTVNELHITSDRRAVLMDMGARLDVEFLRRLASTLVQSIQIGAPLSRSLRLLAQELRQEQMIGFEARAARLPVMLTVPMVAFIMPTVLLIVGGPAAVQLLRMQ